MAGTTAGSTGALPTPARRSPAIVPTLVALLVVGMVAYLRISPERKSIVPIAYAVPLLVCLWFRSRVLLWVMVVGFTGVSIAQNVLLRDNKNLFLGSRLAAFGMVELDTVVVALVFHFLIGARQALERRNALLETGNRELAEREETVAAQNEELQAKTEELERQGEELRVTNEELEMRERMLEQLLELSHSLTAELTRGQLTARLCDAVSSLLNIPGSGCALLEREGETLKVVGCEGFSEGLSDEPIAYETSFAALVIDRGQTAYVEDLRRRPDLVLPRMRGVAPMRSVLSTPLRVHGKPMGTIEMYSPEPRNWSRKEIALLEALAAQASTSMENLHLFEEVEDQRRRLETIFRTLPVGVMISDATYSDVRMNAAGAAMVGESPEVNFARADAVGGRWWVEQERKVLQHSQRPIVRALRKGEEVQGHELDIVFHDGRRLTVLAAAAPIKDRSAARTLGAVSTFVDITPLKNLQRELIDRREEAEEASIRKTRFLAAVSHDIRTPANAINLLAELLRRAANTPSMAAELPQMAAELQASALSLVNLVSDVLDVTRYDYGKIELNETDFSLAELIEEQVRQLRPLAQAKSLTLETSLLPPMNLTLHTDRTKLARVVSNLLGNAIKFTESGAISVRAMLLPGMDSHPEGELRLSVTDSGMGISAEHLPRIFDEFFQIKNPARDRTKGAGLGLAICKRLVEAMGGRLTVQSEIGIGTSFTVSMPGRIVVNAPPDAMAKIVPIPVNELATHRLVGRHVLLVEDHAPTRAAAAALLEAERAEVTVAADGATALKLLADEARMAAYDAVLLDIVLPDMEGAELLRYLAAHRPKNLRAVLVLTGDVSSERTAEALALGADAVIHKPIDIQAIVRLLVQRGR